MAEDKNLTRNNTNSRKRDLLHTWSALWLWVLPLVIINVANALYGSHHISFTTQGIVQIVGTLWIGVACLANAFQCGRVHCKIDGTLLPLLSIIGLLNVLRVISFNWTTYADIFDIIIVFSFVAEYIDNRLHHKIDKRTVC